MTSVTASLLTLAWSVASFVRAVRLCEPALGNLSILDLVLLTLSHFCSIAAVSLRLYLLLPFFLLQVMSFSLFASKLLVAFVMVVAFHWVLMSLWVLSQLLCFPRTASTRAAFAHDRQRGLCHQLDDVLYAGAMGLVFLFTFVDVGGVAPKTQSLMYHVLRLLEEAVLLTVWWVRAVGAARY
ncbi:XK-related protein 6 [Penaeus vannamei]|uniref:XK-related protein n=1 Tax=Penaeus vannamei TaxID=6689 RepID=A0A423T5M4_PENVA|nr:XK-related protein 6 [Penaeus vannamei]